MTWEDRTLKDRIAATIKTIFNLPQVSKHTECWIASDYQPRIGAGAGVEVGSRGAILP